MSRTTCVARTLLLAVLAGTALPHTAAVAQPGATAADKSRLTTRTAPVAALRASRPVLQEVERQDVRAAAAQARVLAADTEPRRRNALAAWEVAEKILDQTRSRAWASIPYARPRALVIDEPLALAMLDLAIGLRRQLGPRFHTVVDGLIDDPGCAGDVVAERLVFEYGRASSVRVLVEGSQRSAEARLHDIAVQIACLSERQLGLFDEALADAFDRTSTRMASYGLRALIPAFARLAAPVEVLVLDGRKHRGQWTRSWQWFAAYGAVIETDVARAGWASGHLLLWDRRTGKLAAFPGCAPGVIRPNCVDFALFLRSMRDPRAIGLGVCALAGMITQPPQLLGLDTRYACPTRTCDAATTTATPAARGAIRSTPMTPVTARTAPAPQSGIEWRWPKLGPGDWSAMSSICRLPGGATQGPAELPGECNIAKPTNPFETFDACIIAAAGGAGTGDSGGSTAGSEQFPGVPSGAKCKFADDAGGETPPYDRCPGQSCENKHDPCPGQSCEGKPADTSPASGGGTPSSGSTPPAKESPPSSGKDAGTKDDAGTPESADAKRRRELEAIIKGGREHPESHAAVQRAQDAKEELDRMNSSDRMRDIMKGLKDCADPGACSDTCTALGRQLAAASACTQGLLGALARATGRPARGDIPPTRPRGPVEHPSPDAPSTSAAVGDTDFCLVGAADPAPPNRACGLELCTDGILSLGTREGCVCDPNRGAWKPLINSCLFRMRCEDGTMPDENCHCTSGSGGAVGGIPPRPMPEWVGVRPTAVTTIPIRERRANGVPIGSSETLRRPP